MLKVQFPRGQPTRSPSSNRREQNVKSRGSQVPRLPLHRYFLGWFSKLTSLLHDHTYLFIGSCSHLVSWPLMGTFKVLSPQWLNLPNAQVTLRREARGSGAVGFASRGFPGYATSLLFKMKFRAPLNVFSCLACESFSLSLLLLHIVLLLIANGLKSLSYWVLARSRCEALLWIIFRTGWGQEHSSR
jgi:hypothetical protein